MAKQVDCLFLKKLKNKRKKIELQEESNNQKISIKAKGLNV